MLADGRRLEVAAFNAGAIGFYDASGWGRVGGSFENVGGVLFPTRVFEVR